MLPHPHNNASLIGNPLSVRSSVMDHQVHIPEQHIILDLQSEDRMEAFSEVAQFLVEQNSLSKEVALALHQELSEREEKTTFAVGKNLAIPHINGCELEECVFLYARSKNGIEFGACDLTLVHHLFFAFIPTEQKCGWLKTLAHIAKALSEQNLRERLIQSDDPIEIRSLLNGKLAKTTKTVAH